MRVLLLSPGLVSTTAPIEAIEGFRFAVVHVENGQQFRDCQQVLEFLREIEKLQLASLFINRGIAGNQLPNATRIDITNFRQIKKNLFLSFFQQATDGGAKSHAAFANRNFPIHIKNGYISGLALRYI